MAEKLVNYQGDTTQRELWEGGPTVKTGVSKLLDPTARAYTAVMFQQGKPPLDSEVNLMQQVQNHLRGEFVRAAFTPGLLSLTLTAGIASPRNSIRLSDAKAIANGNVVSLYGANRTDNASDVIFPAAPYSGSRQDLAFVEFWEQEVAPTNSPEDDDENVYRYGGVNSGTYPNDLQDSTAGDETTRRVQQRWRLRTIGDINFNAYPAGVTHADRVKARGGASEDTNYTFGSLGNGLYRAGDGSQDAGRTLKSVDGYVYALPLFKVTRRNQSAYDPVSNPDGAPSYGGGVIATGLYHDVIEANDIEALFTYAGLNTNSEDGAVGILALDLAQRLRQVNIELEKWQKQRLQQGTAKIYNRFVVYGGIVRAVSGTRNVNITKTGSYTVGNYSLVHINGEMVSIEDTQDSVATIPTNSTGAAVNYYVYLDAQGAPHVAAAKPEDGLALYRITVPAGDVAANLNACTLTDVRRVETNYNAYYNSVPFAVVELPGYAAINCPNYDVKLTVESANDSGRTVLEVYDKASNGFKIRSLGTADNIAVRWTLLNPTVE